MHIALCGPASLDALSPYLDSTCGISTYRSALVPTLAVHYLQLGFRITVVTTSFEINRPTILHGSDLSVYVVPSQPRAAHRAINLWRLERQGVRNALIEAAPDIVHAHWTYEFALGAIQCRSLPVLVTAHDDPWTVLRHYRDPYRVARLMLALRTRLEIRHLSAVSPHLAQRWHDSLYYRRQINVIPNPVPPLERVSGQRRAGSILEVADSSRLKNVETLLKAFLLVQREIPHAQLRLVGSGLGPQDPLATQARRQGLASNVTFLGVLDRAALAREYSQADLFCHASLEEAQPLVLLEAMYFELPIIAGARSGGVPWTLFDGAGGQLVDVSSVDELAAAIASNLNERPQPAAPKRPVVDLLNERFGLDSIGARYLDLYQEVLRATLR